MLNSNLKGPAKNHHIKTINKYLINEQDYQYPLKNHLSYNTTVKNLHLFILTSDENKKQA